MDRLQRQLPGYLMVGCGAAALDYGGFHVLVGLGAGIITSNLFSFMLGFFFSFFLNTFLTYRLADMLLARLSRFALVCAIGYVAGTTVILLQDQLGVPLPVAKLNSMILVFILQFTMNSAWTFKTFLR